MILFKVGGKCGYPLRDALKRLYTGLGGRDDEMFVDCKSCISIRVEVRVISVMPSKRWSFIFFFPPVVAIPRKVGTACQRLTSRLTT